MVFSDLTTILSKHRSDSEGVLGSLREVYDGSYVRRLGNGALLLDGSSWPGRRGDRDDRWL